MYQRLLMKWSSGAQICLAALFRVGRMHLDLRAGIQTGERARLPHPDAAVGVERRGEVVVALVIDHPRVSRVPRPDERVGKRPGRRLRITRRHKRRQQVDHEQQCFNY